MKPKLFLLEPDFEDKAVSMDRLFYCPDSALVEGILSYYPQLKDSIDIRYLSFGKPREQLVELLGEQNQLCPVLIVSETTPNTDTFK